MMCAQQRKGIFHSNVWKDPTERYSSASLQFPCYGTPGTLVHGSYEYSYGRADEPPASIALLAAHGPTRRILSLCVRWQRMHGFRTFYNKNNFRLSHPWESTTTV